MLEIESTKRWHKHTETETPTATIYMRAVLTQGWDSGLLTHMRLWEDIVLQVVVLSSIAEKEKQTENK